MPLVSLLFSSPWDGYFVFGGVFDEFWEFYFQNFNLQEGRGFIRCSTYVFFEMPTLLYNYTNFRHNKDEWWPVCVHLLYGQSYEQRQNCIRHIKYKHIGHVFTCNLCSTNTSTYISELALLEHKIKHVQALPFGCCYCCASYAKTSTLQAHMRKQHPAQPAVVYKCTFTTTPPPHSHSCALTFDTKAQLLHHYQQHYNFGWCFVCIFIVLCTHGPLGLLYWRL